MPTTVACRYPVHEPQASVQVASFSAGNHPGFLCGGIAAMLSRNRNKDSMMLERGGDVDHTTIQILLAKSKNAVIWVGLFRDETMRELFGELYTLVLAYRALRSNKT